MAETDRKTLVERLSTLLSGPVAGGFALDATITPETFARSADLGPRVGDSVGPLPRIALSGDAAARPASYDALPASADLEIVGVLGEGGMGRVHLARQRSLGREVAVKTLKAEVADARTVSMLRAEATTMGRLEHPNVVPVHAVGLDDGGRLVLVMKRIDGVSWRELLRDPDHPRWANVSAGRDRLDAHLDVLEEVARALEFAHAQGIVHRDVKPENVLLGAHGEVYLADWGVALRLSDAVDGGTELVGTPAYMAPEMVVGDRKQIDARSDVFLLGATLHEVLTGKPPHDGATLHETLIAAFESTPKTYDASVPDELADIARRAMAVRAADRFASAAELRLAIVEVRRHRGSIALTREAKALLESLRTAPHDATTDRRFTECRFALVSALRDWPENREARRTLDGCLRLMIEHELARENAAAAASLLDELSVEDAALAAKVAALREKLDARLAEAAKLKALEADQDLGVGLWARSGALALLAVASVVITIVIVARGGSDDGMLDPGDPLKFGTVVFLVVLVPIVVFRRYVLANAVGRHASVIFLLVTTTMLLHRSLAYYWGVSPSVTLSMDMAVMAGITATSGIIVPRLALAALVPLAGAVCSVVYPDRVAMIFSVMSLGTIVAVGAIWLRLVRERSTKPP